MDLQKASEPGPGGVPAFYFRSLRSLLAQHKEQIEQFDWLDRSVLGGTLDVAVVFIDLSNFSGMSSQFPEKPHGAAFLGHHFLSLVENWSISVLKDKVNSIYIDKCVGDAVMLVIPGSESEAMTKAMVMSLIVMQIPLYESKIGVQWGPVWLGDVGLPARLNRFEHFESVTVMGHNVNIAARLVGKAEKGQLVMLKGRQTPELEPLFAKWDSKPEKVPLKGVLPADAQAEILRLTIKPAYKLFQGAAPGELSDPVGVVKDYLKRVDKVPRLDQGEEAGRSGQ